MAQDTDSTRYTNCADVLRKSILRVMPDANQRKCASSGMIGTGESRPLSYARRMRIIERPGWYKLVISVF
jgi:hypothetical protein